jgi:uncharacterized protein
MALLEIGGPVDLKMARVSAPDLGIHPSEQRYTFARPERGRTVIRYENADGSFAADLTFDQEGLVIDYPRIGRRISENSQAALARFGTAV